MITFELKLKDFKRGFVDTTKKKVQKGVDRGLIYMGGYIKKIAQNSIHRASSLSKRKRGELLWRNGEPISQPGQPPLNKTGLLRDNIFSKYDYGARVVTIGPAKLNGRGNATAALEFGGPSTILVADFSTGRLQFRPEIVYIRARPYMRPALKKALEPKNLKKFFGKLTVPQTIVVLN